MFREAIRKMRKRSSLAEVLPERPSRTAIQHAAARQAVAPRATTQVGRRRQERIIGSPGAFKDLQGTFRLGCVEGQEGHIRR